MEAKDWRNMRNAIVDLALISKAGKNIDKEVIANDRIKTIKRIERKNFLKTRARLEQLYKNS